MADWNTQTDSEAGIRDAPDESTLLGFCPHCDYALTGLPVHWNCPEGGLAIDRRWQVFGGNAIKHRNYGWFEFGRVAFIGAPLISLVWMVIAALSIPPGGAARSVVLWLPVALIAFIALLVRFRPKQCIVLAPDGLLILKGKKELSRYEWAGVDRADHDFLRKSIAFDYEGRRVRLKNFTFFGVNMDEIDKCVAAINRYERSNLDNGPSMPIE